MLSPKEQLLSSVEQTGVLVVRQMPRFFGSNEDHVFPYTILTIILPGHMMHPLDCTDDFTYALLFISPKMLDDLRFYTFSHDLEKFNIDPVCSLTDEQAAHMLAIVDQLDIIANHTDKELPHRYQTLLAQLAVGYEFLNYYRRNQDRQWAENRQTDIFNRFCDLVVKHYRESREVKFYANLLNLTPKHLSKVIHAATNGLSPVKWIEQYVTAQAKRLIETRATQTLQETAYMLGFTEPTAFYRYFKRGAGMTAKQYRDRVDRRGMGDGQ